MLKYSINVMNIGGKDLSVKVDIDFQNDIFDIAKKMRESIVLSAYKRHVKGEYNEFKNRH